MAWSGRNPCHSGSGTAPGSSRGTRLWRVPRSVAWRGPTPGVVKQSHSHKRFHYVPVRSPVSFQWQFCRFNKMMVFSFFLNEYRSFNKITFEFRTAMKFYISLDYQFVSHSKSKSHYWNDPCSRRNFPKFLLDLEVSWDSAAFWFQSRVESRASVVIQVSRGFTVSQMTSDYYWYWYPHCWVHPIANLRSPRRNPGTK